MNTGKRQYSLLSRRKEERNRETCLFQPPFYFEPFNFRPGNCHETRTLLDFIALEFSPRWNGEKATIRLFTFSSDPCYLSSNSFRKSLAPICRLARSTIRQLDCLCDIFQSNRCLPFRSFRFTLYASRIHESRYSIELNFFVKNYNIRRL